MNTGPRVFPAKKYPAEVSIVPRVLYQEYHATKAIKATQVKTANIKNLLKKSQCVQYRDMSCVVVMINNSTTS